MRASAVQSGLVTTDFPDAASLRAGYLLNFAGAGVGFFAAGVDGVESVAHFFAVVVVLAVGWCFG